MEAQLSRPLMALRLIFLLCFFSALARCCRFLAAEAAPTLVTRLPGLDGALPFRLETGHVFLVRHVRSWTHCKQLHFVHGRYVIVDEEKGSELFYYFIESEGDPRRDPVVLWLTGGDRCSVLRALLFEIGPLKIIGEPYNGTIPRLRYHPYSWTKVASILFVDSPVGAGFSFSRNPTGYHVGEVSSSLQLKKFLTKWSTEHPYYIANHFYIGGDSAGGKIVPFLAQKISEDIEARVRPLINLKGYLVGNPGTGESIDFESRVPFLHGMGIISDQLYETIMEHCHGEVYTNPKTALCAQASDRFDRNYGTYLSYFWANNNITRDALGIKKGSKDEWVRCHEGDLPYSFDIKSTIKYHRNMTLKGYPALVYSGDHDSAVPFLGTQSWVRSLNFPIVDEWRAWHLDGQSAGFTITYTNNLTFATVKGGGHTAPEFQPERCLAMFRRWVCREPL
ncbi:serine carboxypeptidase-like 11 isoform X3 [Aegilops tauschii subsp. strangulata]|uniref:Serine carboxypeptidase-like 19 n=5 Tax=Aegilops tauschii subsp. strangulata TaxID=200361 RepID=A0A453MTH8_AEGTS|nr:serine carboxypeptidase-like 11 isoform X2 [Aegilops tauschii subsp. strangulata]XP_044417847.1 serine carboxypeptidase-like 11 isoform X2 [Triticum aestivum]